MSVDQHQQLHGDLGLGPSSHASFSAAPTGLLDTSPLTTTSLSPATASDRTPSDTALLTPHSLDVDVDVDAFLRDVAGPSTIHPHQQAAPPLAMTAAHEPPGYPTDDLKWTAVLGRDTSAETAFVYCVKSTKIFCRPTCPSRRPRRENVEFATDSSEAATMGYRSCRRCLPEGLSSPHEARQGIAVAHAQVVIREAVQAGRPVPSLSELAETVGMSKFYFLRVFKSSVGTTPDRFARILKSSVRTVAS